MEVIWRTQRIIVVRKTESVIATGHSRIELFGGSEFQRAGPQLLKLIFSTKGTEKNTIKT